MLTDVPRWENEPTAVAERLAPRVANESSLLATLQRLNEIYGWERDDDELAAIAASAYIDKMAFVDEWLRYLQSL
jgi:hypothetical protein